MIFNTARAMPHPKAARSARRAVDVLHGKVAESVDQACARMLAAPLWQRQSVLVRNTYRFAFYLRWGELDQEASS